jgi:DNA (cytosine-5)-methyltransferase 1
MTAPTARPAAPPTCGSLFSGIGGLDLGLGRAGWDCRWQVEIDGAANRVLARRWPEVRRYGDIAAVDPAQLEPVDLLCGGFPCQDLSVAGARAGLAGARSGLFREFVRLAADLRPRWLLIENVPGLLSSNGGRDMGTVVGALAELGYGWGYRCLDAQHFGLAQRRLRVFIIGCLGDPARAAQVLFEPAGGIWDSAPRREEGARLAASLTSGVARARGVNPPGRRGEDDVNIIAGTFQNTGHGWWNESPVAQTIRTPEGGGSMEANVIAIQDAAMPREKRQHGMGDAHAGPMYTLDSHGAHAVAHALTGEGHDGSEDGTGRGTPLVFDWQSGGDVRLNISEDGSSALQASQVPALMQGMAVRRLTPVECERLQGLPDDWTAGESDSARYRLLGNSVAVPVAEWIARRMLAVL